MTIQTEFKETLIQVLYAGNDGGSINQSLVDIDSRLKNDTHDDTSLESAAADNELVKIVDTVIVHAYNQKVSDSCFEPMLGKAKSGIPFNFDGALQPHIKLPARFRSGHGEMPKDHVRPRNF